MASIDPAKRKAIRDELIANAKAGIFPYYGQFGHPLGIPARWRLWKDYLDDISRGEIAANLPDVTWIVRSTRVSGLPGQMDMQKVIKPTPYHWKRASEKAQEIIEYYCPGASNPFIR